VDSYQTAIKYYLERFQSGEYDAAFFGLLEQNKEILPHLMDAYKAEVKADIRCFLVEVIWQHRDPTVVPFLDEVLDDENPKVWKQALDGLVALASPSARQVLSKAQARLHHRKDMETWLHEALEQVDETLEDRN
jgi:hypothetical protein